MGLTGPIRCSGRAPRQNPLEVEVQVGTLPLDFIDFILPLLEVYSGRYGSKRPPLVHDGSAGSPMSEFARESGVSKLED